MSKFLSVAEQLSVIKRGIVELIPESELILKLERSVKESRPLRIKAGFDPTSPDIHLGHTVLLQKLRQFQDLGHEVLFVIGDFTAMIGDPTGQNEARPKLTKATTSSNAKSYQLQAYKILDESKTQLLFNSKWLSKLSIEDTVELASKQTVARMLERDDFSKRYKSGQPILLHEFLYPLLQAYDSVHLQADLELGGTDQKFNLLLGRELQRDASQEPQAIITTPLIEGLDGVRKMSKSYNNYIGITDSPDEMFGKVMSISDSLMLRYYELLSDISLFDLESLKTDMASAAQNPKNVKVKLAKELVSRFHTTKLANLAADSFENLFVKKEVPKIVDEICLESGDNRFLVAILAEQGVTSSRSEGRRLISQGAIQHTSDGSGKYVKISDPDYIVPVGSNIFKVGKKRFLKIVK
ncbi:MAG: tyrosine--tRNA ligase [Nitrospinota bacterium]